MTVRAAWIGLGVMGFPMAGHLAKRGGLAVTVYNRSPGKAEKWQAAHGGATATTPGKAAAGADFVFACVGNDDDLRQVAVGPEGAFHTMKPGTIFVDHTTASAGVARELHAEAKRRGLGFIDAPVSGGQAGAENGMLTIMCGGEAADYVKAEPLIAHYSRMRKLLGPAGAGQLAKMCNQIAIAGLVEGLVRRMRAELGEQARVVATGGLAELIAAETDVIEVVEPNLTLIGLRMIYEMNRDIVTRR